MSYNYDGGSFSGQSYDRHIFEANLSTVNKMQREYWTAKQVLKKKFGKGEDQHVVAGDAELDAKLCQFESIQRTCVQLLKEMEHYQAYICALAKDENQLGRFLKDQGSQDKTKAGKMMGAVGKSLCYTAQQRLLLRHPLGRLHQDVETFRYRAIADSIISIDKMEEERTHYRGSLMWMQDISSNLDPEQFKKLEKFRKVQNEVRLNKDKFDRLKWAVCQKIDLLSASRSNLFSNTLVPYQDELLQFWEKTARTMSAVLESFKGYQHYEFKLLKDLNPIQELDTTTEDTPEKKTEGGVSEDNDDALIALDDSEKEDKEMDDPNQENNFHDAMDALDLNENDSERVEDSLINFDQWKDNCNGGRQHGLYSDVYQAIRNQDQIVTSEKNHLVNEQIVDPEKSSAENGNLLDFGEESSKEDLDLLNDILGNNDQEGNSEFENQWKSVFGEFESASPPQSDKPPNEPSKNGDQIDFDPLSGSGLVTGQQSFQAGAGASNINQGGYLPSQLMDLHLGGYASPMGNPSMMQHMHHPAGMTQANQQMMMRPPMMMNQQNFIPNPPAYSSMFGSGMAQRPSTPTGAPANSTKKGKDKGSMAAWYNLFAELDPLQNPDALGKKDKGETGKPEGGAC